jgi:1-pyrroline-5-carboxylate dehydrogenase
LEIFGPVLSVIAVRDFDEALKIANDNPYGLIGGVYSKNPHQLERARIELVAGNVNIYRSITGALVGAQPFGGYGLSGTDSKTAAWTTFRCTCSPARSWRDSTSLT